MSKIILNNSNNIYPGSDQTIETYVKNQSGKLFTQIIL